MDLRLLVLQGKPQGKELPVQNSPFLIGRGPECHLRPNSDMVSRRHCVLIVHGQDVLIRDLGSTNGTIVDGERLEGDLKLTDGDIFQVGPLIFQVVIRATPVTQPAPAGSEVTPARPQRGTFLDAADEIAQWLVSDSKSDVPETGSGVYSGKTVFNVPKHEAATNSSTDASHSNTDAAQPAGTHESAEHAEITGDAGGRKGHAPHPHKEVQYGAAALAAEDMIRQFLHRRPHK